MIHGFRRHPSSHCFLILRVWVAISHSHLSVQEREGLLIVVSKDPRSLLLTRCHLFSCVIFCQDAALRMAPESGIPRCIPVCSGRNLPVLLLTDQGEGWSCGPRYNCADNFRVVRDTEVSATEACNMVANAMIRVGLQAHDEVRATCDAETLGVRLLLDTGVATMSTKRKWRLRSGCRKFAQRKRTCGHHLEKIMGNQTFASLLARGSLSILFANCIGRAAKVEPLRTWKSVREELETSSLVSRGRKFVPARMPPLVEAL